MKKYVVNWVGVHDERYVSFLGIEGRAFSSREEATEFAEEAMKNFKYKAFISSIEIPEEQASNKKESASQNFDDGYNQFLLRQAGRVRYVTPVHTTIQTIYGKL